jgi:hypothetical protein
MASNTPTHPRTYTHPHTYTHTHTHTHSGQNVDLKEKQYYFLESIYYNSFESEINIFLPNLFSYF